MAKVAWELDCRGVGWEAKVGGWELRVFPSVSVGGRWDWYVWGEGGGDSLAHGTVRDKWEGMDAAEAWVLAQVPQ